MKGTSIKNRGIRFFALVLSILLVAAIGYSTINFKASVVTAYASEAEAENVGFDVSDIMDISIADLTDALDSELVTSEQVVQWYIDRIETYDKSLDLNSIIAINEDALDQAIELDAMRADGDIKGSLHGVPIIVKDNYDYEGMATTAGASALANNIANNDAYTVRKLQEAGAIILAKANMSEFAFSGSNSRSCYGTVHNAYDTSKTPAGSSGGTATAIASNFATAGMGTDTGSSIRRPSSFGDLYGLRPSKGLTSIDGVVPLNADRDVTGPMCSNASDLAYMMDAIAGTDEEDHYTVDADADSLIPEGGYTSVLTDNALEGKKIGYLTNSFGINATTSYSDQDGSYKTTMLSEDEKTPIDAKISGLVDDALDVLEDGGATVVDVSSIISDEIIFNLYSGASVSLEGTSVFEWDMYEYFQAIGADSSMDSLYDIIQDGGYISGLSRYGVAKHDLVNPRFNVDNTEKEAYTEMWSGYQAFRTGISTLMEENDIDALVYMSQTDVACEEDVSDDSSKINSNSAAYLNKFGPVAGLPDIMIPIGFSGTDEETETPMPIGLSMCGQYGDDENLIQIAYGYEQTAQNAVVLPSNSPVIVYTELGAVSTVVVFSVIVLIGIVAVVLVVKGKKA